MVIAESFPVRQRNVATFGIGFNLNTKILILFTLVTKKMIAGTVATLGDLQFVSLCISLIFQVAAYQSLPRPSRYAIGVYHVAGENFIVQRLWVFLYLIVSPSLRVVE